jgi:two-component system KDP operon response regulator KdpE
MRTTVNSRKVPRFSPTRPQKRLHVLLASDKSPFTNAISLAFEQEGFEVLQSKPGANRVEAFFQSSADVVILDFDTLDEQNLQELRLLRSMTRAPLVVTVQPDESMISYLLDIGADDCIKKPISPRELTSRVKAILRRMRWTTTLPDQAVVQVDHRLQIDFNRCEAIVEGKRIRLSAIEQLMLHLLMQNAGWTVPHIKLLRFIWGHEEMAFAHYVRLYINYLRGKIEKDTSDPQYIISERGYGYRFVDFQENAEQK